MAGMVGTVQAIGRYPVKSMQGESLGRARLEATGIPGDRAHALIDVDTGKVASAKDPRAWGQLLAFRAAWSDRMLAVTLPDGSVVGDDLDRHLSSATGRHVRLTSTAPEGATYDYVWDVPGIAPEEVVTSTQTGTTEDGAAVSAMPIALGNPGTFQDVAPITILTTAALRAMRAHHPEGDWSPDRFRPNLLLAVDGDTVVENDWVGRRLAIGDVVLEVTMPSPRCVMTTLPQLGLARDKGILQTVARHNMVELEGFGRWACLGAYANVLTVGEVAVGDEVTLRLDP